MPRQPRSGLVWPRRPAPETHAIATLEAIRPGLATLIASAIVGVATFVGVLLYGPAVDPATRTTRASGANQGNPSTDAGQFVDSGFRTDPSVQAQVRAFIGQGLDFAAIAMLDDYLDDSPDFAWGWMLAIQLSQQAQDPNRKSERLLKRARVNLARLDREDRLPPINTGSNYTNWFVAGWAARAAGDEDRARETFLAGLEQNTRQTQPGSVARLYDGACLLALAGETDEALDRIEQLAETGYNNPRWLSRDPDLHALHDDPRFGAALRRLNDRLTPPPAANPDTESQTEPGP